MKEFKVGDKVICIRRGKGVIRFHRGSLGVVFDDKDKAYWYMRNGRFDSNDFIPTLYHADEFPLPLPPKLLPDLAVDTKVFVWRAGQINKRKRHFAKFSSSGQIICFDGGKTEFTSNGIMASWDHWELAEWESLSS